MKAAFDSPDRKAGALRDLGQAEAMYLCQHANRSKLAGWRGAAEVAGGWLAWQAAGLPIEHAPG